ncbi:Crp/Fnr family transcriptional regulator [Undibacterium sp. TS12]|uniref:Crp/Fnr family transcriptional regulator n=1 Tax=Undibacterium sp. TS12 TaxID=2908202 RepID=UPI001F4C9547|nr:Crp/Fnr family transcriptional regulator [Undibacterium sp. TS12]MCH8622731.1 Crp/Fnr family transcriptional regulator [Undibacterium sp. TS12]
MMTKIDVLSLLQNHSLFRNISCTEFSALQADISKIELGKGMMLCRKGDLAEGIYIVVFGLIKLCIPSPRGHDKVLELIRAGQSLGEAMMFIDEPYPFYAEALEHTLLLKLPRATVLQLLERSPLLSRQMMTGLSHRLLGFIHNVEAYSLQNSTQRVIDYLLRTASQQDSKEIRLELKKHLLASLLNLTPETLSRVLHQLTQESLIKVCGATIHIASIEALRSYHEASAELHSACH